MQLIDRLMSWLSSLSKPPESFLDVREVMKIPTALSNGGQFDFDLVGESHYQRRIKTMLPDSITDEEKQKVYFVGLITLEDDNEHDKYAISFSIDDRVVGYFPKESNRKFRKMIKDKAVNLNKLTCKAVVVGGKDKSYGIWLEINIHDIK